MFRFCFGSKWFAATAAAWSLVLPSSSRLGGCGVAEAAEVSGYLIDKKCLDLCANAKPDEACAPDGSNVFYAPQKHTGWCLQLQVCVDSGYVLVSEFPTGDDGKHSIVLDLDNDASQSLVVSHIEEGTLGPFPLVTVEYDEAEAQEVDGVVNAAGVTVRDSWATDDSAPYYSGAAAHQVLCEGSASPDLATNNMCFRSDVIVAETPDDAMYVIESNGCPDHASMQGSSGRVPNPQGESSTCDGGKCGSCGSTKCDGGKCDSCGSTKCDGGKCGSCGSCGSGACDSGGCGSCGSTKCDGGCGSCGSGACDGGCGSCGAGKCDGGCGSCGSDKCDGGCGSCGSGKCDGGCGSCGSCAAGCGTCCAGGCGSCGSCTAGCGTCCAGCCGTCDSVTATNGHGGTPGKYDPKYQHYRIMIPKTTGEPGEPKHFTKDDEVVGILANGILLDNHKPTWSYDNCNGHSDTKHMYHYHIPPRCLLEGMGVGYPKDTFWWKNGDMVREYADMAAQWPANSEPSPVLGFALDGYPIFGPYDDARNLQRGKDFGGDLDECNGKVDAQGNYGYYLTVDPPFAPPCLRGEKGTFSYHTTNLSCPKNGIKTTVFKTTGGDCASEKFSEVTSCMERKPAEELGDSGGITHMSTAAALGTAGAVAAALCML